MPQYSTAPGSTPQVPSHADTAPFNPAALAREIARAHGWGSNRPKPGFGPVTPTVKALQPEISPEERAEKSEIRRINNSSRSRSLFEDQPPGSVPFIRAGKCQPLGRDQILEKTGTTPDDCLYDEFQNSDPESLDLAGSRQSLLEETYGWREAKKLSMLGLINGLLFQVFRGVEGIYVSMVTEDGKKIWQAVPGVLRTVFKSGQILLSTAVGWLAKNVNRHWLAYAPGGARSVTAETVRAYLQELRELGLLDWAEQSFEPGRYGRCRLFTGMDFTRLCLLAEVIETDLLASARAELPPDCESGDEMPAALPPHFGTVTKIIHDAGIPGFGYGRAGDPGETPPTTYADTDKRRLGLGIGLVNPATPKPGSALAQAQDAFDRLLWLRDACATSRKVLLAHIRTFKSMWSKALQPGLMAGFKARWEGNHAAI